jgi:hypothetical protein
MLAARPVVMNETLICCLLTAALELARPELLFVGEADWLSMLG